MAEQVVESERPASLLGDFHVVRSSAQRQLFRYSPYLIATIYLINLAVTLGSLLVVGTPPADDPVRHYLAPVYDPIYISLHVALLALVAAMGYFFREIPRAVEQLWRQGVIRAYRRGEAQDFRIRFEQWLNHPGRWVLGGVFGLLGVPFVHFVVFEGNFSFYAPNHVPDFARDYALAVNVSDYLNAVTLPAYLAVLGIQVWRMVATAMVIRRIPRWFDVHMQANHPDKCGGFRPLGELCLAMVYVVLVPAVYVGFWLLISQQAGWLPSLETSLPPYVLDPSFRVPVVGLLVLLMGAGVAGFFWPLWSIHELMLAERGELQRVLDDVAVQIHRLEERSMTQASTMSADEREKLFKEIESLTKLYEKNRSVPTWPFERSAVAKLVSAQALPLLSMIGLTGPASSILKFIGTLFGG